MTTFAEGVTLAEDAPPTQSPRVWREPGSASSRMLPSRSAWAASTGEEANAGDGGGSAGRDGKVFIVKKLVLQVDVKKIKQLQDLLEIVGELEDKINSGEDPDDDPETDFALA